MGNKAPQKSYFNLREKNDLSRFIENINMLDGFYMDTTLSISSKCLVIINNLMNSSEECDVKLMSDYNMEKDESLMSNIEKLKFHCGLIKHLAVVNSAMESVEELVELNNVKHLTSLSLDHVPIRFVQHLKQHRDTLVKLCANYCLDNLESIISLCGGDHSFTDKWCSLVHLDVRCNRLRVIDSSVQYLTSLTVLDISRNDVDDLSFIKKIPTLVCLNASFNHVRHLPSISGHGLRVLIMGYNYLDGLEGIKSFKVLSTLNVAFNMISSNDYLQQLKEMDFLKDVILRGNPLSFSDNYRRTVLDIVSPRVAATFAIDGKCLNKKENAYLRKRTIIIIPPAISPSNDLYKEVPVVNLPSSDTTCGGAQSAASRTMHRPMIEDSSDCSKYLNSEEGDVPDIRKYFRKEKKIDSLSATDTDLASMTMTNSVFLHVPVPVISMDDSNLHIPNYVGEKTSNLYVVFPGMAWRPFVRVSIQIFEHKFMAVNDTNVTVENSDLWRLMAVKGSSSTCNVLKMVFFESCDEKNNGQLSLSSRTVEFEDELEMSTFMEGLSMYLYGFFISVADWEELCLVNLSVNCEKCGCTVFLNNVNPRPYSCSYCFCTRLLLQNTSLISVVSPMLNETPNQDIQRIKDLTPTNISPGLKHFHNKSSTSNLVIRAFGSTDSLQQRSGSQSGRTSSYYTAVNDINPTSNNQSQDGLNSSSLNSSLKGSIRSKETDEYDDDQHIQRDLGKSSSISFPCDLDRALNFDLLNMGTTIVPHECQEEYAAYAALKSILKVPWVIHEPSYDINIHMHNSKKIADRVNIYLLTKVMKDQEKLLSVYKAFVVHKSAVTASASLVVISDIRVMIYNYLDKTSNNIEECLKLVCDIKLKHLEKLEYCIYYQWVELQVKGKSTITLLVGDAESGKNMGFVISEAYTLRTGSLSVIYSKELSMLKSPQVLSAMQQHLNVEGTMTSLDKSECYLVRSCTLLSKIEKSSLEYGPKLMVIVAEHIFFITFSYSTKASQPLFELSQTILLFNVKNNIIVDSQDECSLRLEVCEHGTKKYVDIQLMSPHSRSKAAFCIGKMLKELFRVEIMYNFDNLSATISDDP